MLILESNTTNPYFNIAAEEYLLKRFTDDFFVLYQNQPSIIVGKHQNTLAEINYSYVKENKIAVVRRLSGGGAVYHDLGNLNFTFIKNAEHEKNLVNFKMYVEPIIDVLNKLGIKAKFEGHNDIRINGLKISGNAEHVFKKRVLHHGTLLFSSDLNKLNEAIKVPQNKYSDKAVKSVRTTVSNISDYVTKEISITEFQNKIIQYVKSTFKNAEEYLFNEHDIEQIQKLISEKYAIWGWNYGYSPNYNLKNKVNTNSGEFVFELNVEKGVILSLSISGIHNSLKVESILTGVLHNEVDVRETLTQFLEQNKLPLTIDEIIQGIF